MGPKKPNFFNGYQDFNYNDVVWNGILKNVKDNDFIELLQLMRISDEQVTKKRTGNIAWGDSGNAFLQLCLDEQKYSKEWLMPFQKMIENKENYIEISECIRMFEFFNQSVPKTKEALAFPSFLWPAQKTAQYLCEVIRCCESVNPKKKVEWVAGGLYVLICLVLQNEKDIECNPWAFVFCRPPAEYDPNPDWEPHMEVTAEANYELKIPDQIPLAQKSYDFWSALHSHFPDLENPEEVSETEEEDIWDGMVKEIMPAQIHRERSSISKEEILPCVTCSPDASVGAFLIEEVPVWNGGQWNIAERLYKLPWVEDPAKSSVKGYGPPGSSMRSICINREVFSDNVAFNGICLSIDKQSDRYFSESFSLLYDYNCGRADHDLDVVILYLNENGHIQSREVEQMMKTYGVQWHANQNDVQKQEITYVCKFKQEYLRYIFLDPLTMEEIPIKGWQDPITGEYLISITLQYPGRFVVMKFVKTLQDNQKANRLALEGYLHGLYGFKKDIREAEKLMKRGALQEDPYMAFEFGALLKKKGLWRSAKNFLKIGADHGIAGSKFELAEILISSENSEDIQEASIMIDSLWEQGYRTYGTSRSIDLLNKH